MRKRCFRECIVYRKRFTGVGYSHGRRIQAGATSGISTDHKFLAMAGNEETNFSCCKAVVLEPTIYAEGGNNLSCRAVWVRIHVFNDFTTKTMISGSPLSPRHGVIITLLPYKRQGELFNEILGQYQRHERQLIRNLLEELFSNVALLVS